MITEGTVINERYKVLRLLGEGGMGAVYEGEHTGVGRKVAIKVLHPEFARRPEAVERFEREAKAAAAIGHDHIIDVLDFGRHEGAPYMVMEFLKGESLTARIDALGKLEPKLAADIMGQMLSALAAAHAVGIVHRDLKPDNVQLLPKGGRDYVKLLDFGISKFSDDAEKQRGLTKTGMIMGTPTYMAPEQALAKRDADHRVDLYAAGVMLYEMLTGAVPFNGDSEAEVLRSVVMRHEGLKTPKEWVPELPDALSELVLKAIALQPTERFESAEEFLAALVPFGADPADLPEGSQVSVPTAQVAPGAGTTLGWERGSSPGSVATPAPRGSKGALLGGLAVLVALVGVGAVLGLRGRATHESAVLASASASAAASAVAAALPSAASAEVQVTLDGLPEGAAVTLEGQPVEGATLTLPRGARRVLRVTAPGRVAFETELLGDRDRTLAVALREAPVEAAATASALASAAPEPSATAAEEPAGRGARPRGRGARPGANGAGAPAPGGHAGAPRGNPLLPVDTNF